jgi:hypothetical protein
MSADLRAIQAVLAQLRHAYAQLTAHEGRWSRRGMQQFADGLIAPQIRKLEALDAACAASAPADLRALIGEARQAIRWFVERAPIAGCSIDSVLQNERDRDRHTLALHRLVNGAESALSAPPVDLRPLIEKWRGHADAAKSESQSYYEVAAHEAAAVYDEQRRIFIACAEELESALLGAPDEHTDQHADLRRGEQGPVSSIPPRPAAGD